MPYKSSKDPSNPIYLRTQFIQAIFTYQTRADRSTVLLKKVIFGIAQITFPKLFLPFSKSIFVPFVELLFYLENENSKDRWTRPGKHVLRIDKGVMSL